MRLYNTLTRSVEPVSPIVPGAIGLYTCGPTLYAYAHIGNFRAYIFEDLLRRHLSYSVLMARDFFCKKLLAIKTEKDYRSTVVVFWNHSVCSAFDLLRVPWIDWL